MDKKQLHTLLKRLVKLPKETEWVEFKLDFHSNYEIGMRISALANSAHLCNQKNGYLVFGVDDTNQLITGTTFKPSKNKVKGHNFVKWLHRYLEPCVDFKIYEFNYRRTNVDKSIVLFEIPTALNQPIRFNGVSYFRVGSLTQVLYDLPERRSEIRKIKFPKTFESEFALRNVTTLNVLMLLNTHAFFDRLKLPYPSNRKAALEKMESEKLIKAVAGRYHITNLGALLFAKDLDEFVHLSRKAPSVIVYDGKNRALPILHQSAKEGYAVVFERLISFIVDQLLAKEESGHAFSKDKRTFPENAIRELTANALIHQDCKVDGTGPMIEIFDDRIEFTNPGLPLISINRLIDECQTRNEVLASFMHRFGIGEGTGSGIDKVIIIAELNQLTAPDFQVKDTLFKAILYSFKEYRVMDKNDKIRAAYQHTCLRYLSNEKMTNESLRKRLNIDDRYTSNACRIISDTLDAKLIKVDDPDNISKRFVKYIPFWA